MTSRQCFVVCYVICHCLYADGVRAVALAVVGGSSGLAVVPIVLYFFTVKFMSLMNVTSGCIGRSLGLGSSATGLFPSLMFF